MAVFTPAANYPPLYYILVGWPTLFIDGPFAWLLMRLLTGVMCATLLTIGAVSIARAWGKPVALASIAAMTPTVPTYFGAINPAGPEIAGCFTLAALLMPVTMDWHKWRGNLVPAGCVAALACLTRPSSLLWVFITVLLTAICVPWRSWLPLLKIREFWICIATASIGVALILLWNRIARPGDSVLGWPEPNMGFSEMVGKMYDARWSYWNGIVALFGWHDNVVPEVVGWAVVCGLIILVVSGLIHGTWPQRLAVVTGVALIPISAYGIQYSLLRTSGIMWQGRYWLPLIATIGVLCVSITARSTHWRDPLAGTLMTLFTFCQLVLLIQNAYRYTSGLGNPFEVNQLTSGTVVGLFSGAAALGLLGILTLRSHRSHRINSVISGSDAE